MNDAAEHIAQAILILRKKYLVANDERLRLWATVLQCVITEIDEAEKVARP